MKNESEWKPSRFVMRSGRLRINKDATKLLPHSRLNASLALQSWNHWIPLRCRGTLVDLGCGTVPFYELYRPHVSEVCCVDWGSSAHDISHIDVTCDLSKVLPLDDNSFDTVICSSVAEHVPDPELLFAEISRILRPAGVLLLNVPFMYGLHEMPHDYYRYTEFALRRFSERAGLKVESLEALGGAPYVLADVAAKTVSRFPAIGGMLASSVQGLTSLLVATPPGRRACEATRERMPSGYFLVASREEEGEATSR